MATTILRNLKEAKNRKASAHLHNAIDYIMNPEKPKMVYGLEATAELHRRKYMMQ